jgi:hypothetical protein
MPCVEGLCCNLHDLFTSQNLAAAGVVILTRGHSTSHAMQGDQHSCRATAVQLHQDVFLVLTRTRALCQTEQLLR